MKKTMKKLLSYALTASMALSLGVNALAETAVEKYDLEVNTAYEKPAKVIFLNDDEIWAFNHPSHNDYRLNAYSFYAQYLKSSPEYELRVADGNKNQLSSPGQKYIEGGMYLIAKKSGQPDEYVPILDQVEENTGINQNYFGGYKPDRTYLTENKMGAFSRAYDESALVFEIPEGVTVANNNSRSEYGFASGEGLKNTSAPLTYEVSVYVDGNAVALISKDGGTELVKIAGNGTLTYVNNGSWTTYSKTLSSGWHRIAIMADKAKNDWTELAVDGSLVSTQLGTWGALPTNVRVGVANGSGSGNVAYADPRAYYGYYVNTYDNINIVKESGSAAIDAQNKTINYNEVVLSTPELLANEIKSMTDAREVRIYTDSSKTETGITANSVAVLISKNYATRDTYNLVQGATPMQKIGLTISDKYEKGFSWTGGVSEINNMYVKKVDDSIAVYSSPNNDYKAYAFKVLNCLTSENGYTLSIVNNEKNFERSSIVEGSIGTRNVDEVVGGDWLKCEKAGEETIYIPIVNKTELYSCDDLSQIGGDAGQTANVNYGKENGIGGKDASDTSYTITPKNAASVTGYSKLQFDSASVKGYYTGLNTFAFNVYAEDDTIVKIGVMINGSLYNALLWNPDGSTSCDVNGTDTDTGIILDREKWHRVAITLDPDRGRLHYWVDGILLTDSSQWVANAQITRIDLGIDAGSTSGKAAFDDLRIYEGYYDAKADSVEVLEENVSASEGVVNYTSQITSLEELKSELGVDSIKLYADKDYQTQTNNLADAKALLAVSSSGVGYNYFDVSKVERKDMLVSSVKDGIYTAKALYKTGEDSIIYIASYNENGKLENVSMHNASSDGSAKLSVENGSSVMKAFLWTDIMNPLTAVCE